MYTCIICVINTCVAGLSTSLHHLSLQPCWQNRQLYVDSGPTSHRGNANNEQSTSPAYSTNARAIQHALHFSPVKPRMSDHAPCRATAEALLANSSEREREMGLGLALSAELGRLQLRSGVSRGCRAFKGNAQASKLKTGLQDGVEYCCAS